MGSSFSASYFCFGEKNNIATNKPTKSIAKFTFKGNSREILVNVGNNNISIALTKEALAICLLEILENFFSFFNPINVLCKNALFVPEAKAFPEEINTEPIINKNKESANIKEIVEKTMQIFAIINVFLCPILSEIHPEGISKIKEAKNPA